jgi:hypothetical protein
MTISFPGRVAEPVLEALEVVLAVVVVLVQDTDLRVRHVLQQVAGIDDTLRVVTRLVSHRPREVRRIVPLRGAGGQEQVRHLLLVHVLVDGGVARRSERVDERRHLVLLDEPSNRLDHLRRTIGVVIADVVDPPAVHAALLVDFLEEGADRAAKGAIGGGGTAVRAGVPDLDLARGLARARRRGQRQADECEEPEMDDPCHTVTSSRQIGTGRTPQISSAYCRMVRSLENFPVWAVLRIDMRVQATGSR